MTMRSAILSLRLSHFRSYRSALLELAGQSVALYGPNGAGKTNVLEAASLLVPGRGLRRASTEELIRAPERIGWKVAADVATPAGEVAIETSAEGPDASRRSVTIDEKAAPQTALGDRVRQVWLTPAMDRLWADGPGDRRRFLDRITLGFAPGHAETALAYEKAMRERNRLLKEGRGDEPDGPWLGALESQMARAGARMARARAVALARIAAAQEQVPHRARALFPKADLAILGGMESRFAQVIRKAAGLPDLDAAELHEAACFSRLLEQARPRDAAAGRALDGPHRSDLEAIYADKSMPARACSTGEQKALLISLCLANARALATETGTPPILLMDEVAAHLDADRRRALYAEISALGAQALATGTSDTLFDGFETRRIAVREVGGESVLDAA